MLLGNVVWECLQKKSFNFSWEYSGVKLAYIILKVYQAYEIYHAFNAYQYFQYNAPKIVDSMSWFWFTNQNIAQVQSPARYEAMKTKTG